MRSLTALAVVTVMVPSVLAVDPTPSINVDPDNRESARQFYNVVHAASLGQSINWTGSLSGCNSGDVSSNWRNAVVLRINYYRYMVGLPAVSVDLAQSAKCQDAALMFSANKQLSHNPPNSWTCYTADGDQAAGASNIHYGSYGVGAIDAYIRDSGASNNSVGHRRWLLYPPLQKVGTGCVERTGSNLYANATWVTGNSGSRPASPTFVAWPNKGYIPYRMIPGSGRWSFSYPNADFATATVTMKVNNVTQTVNIEHRNGPYADRTIVWNSPGTPSHISAPASDVNVDITISGMKLSGLTQPDISYRTIVFDHNTGGSPPASARRISVSMSPDPGASVKCGLYDASNNAQGSTQNAGSANWSGLDPTKTYTARMLPSGSS